MHWSYACFRERLYLAPHLKRDFGGRRTNLGRLSATALTIGSRALRPALFCVATILLSVCVAGVVSAQGMNPAVGVGDLLQNGGLADSVGQGSGGSGLPPAATGQIRSRIASGGQLANNQIEELCVRMAMRHMTPDQVAANARAMGLSDAQAAQLEGCAQNGSGQNATSTAIVGQPSSGPSVTGTNAGPQQTSSIELGFDQLLNPWRIATNPTPTNLKQFGYAAFSSSVSTFAPVVDVPVGPDYVLGPGDELKLMIWGRANRTLNLTISPDGAVFVPDIGPQQVAGLTLEQARQMLVGRLDQITGVQSDVTMGRLRSIQVFVVGEVTQPGVYTVSALARVSNALVAAGGISKIGSLRRIELRRKGRAIKVIDLYDLLLAGDDSADLRLEAEDVIFVPPIGRVAGVVGDVKRPAIYELAGNASIAGLLRLSGGISAFGYGNRIQVERIQNHQQMAVLDVAYDQAADKAFPILDGDLVRVYPVLPDRKDVVVLKGNVNRPGTYQWRPGMRVTDLIQTGEGTGKETFLKYALIRRVQGDDQSVHLVPIDLEAALDPNTLNIPSDADLTLEPQDELTIFSQGQIGDYPTVRVFGEVRNPGSYSMEQGMRVSDLVYQAGGLRHTAYQGQADIVHTRVLDGLKTVYIYQHINLAAAMAGNADENPPLERDDALFVHQVPDWHTPGIIMVSGEVLRPGPYAIRAGEQLASVLERCGGFLPDAYPQAAVFIRASVKKAQQEQIDDARSRLQQELSLLQVTEARSSSQQQPITIEQMTMLEGAISQSMQHQAQGRVVIHLTGNDALAESSDNVTLENGDDLVIPKRPSSVNVLGEVYSPTAVIYQPGLMVRDYLARAGGPTQTGNVEGIMLVRADGSVLTEQGIKSTEESRMFPLLPLLSGGLMEERLGPGDTIYVPEQLEFESKLAVAKDVTQIIANSALSLGTLGIMGSVL